MTSIKRWPIRPSRRPAILLTLILCMAQISACARDTDNDFLNNFQSAIINTELDRCEIHRSNFTFKNDVKGRYVFDDDVLPSIEVKINASTQRYFAVFSDKISYFYENDNNAHMKILNLLSKSEIKFSGWITEKRMHCGRLSDLDGVFFISHIGN